MLWAFYRFLWLWVLDPLAPIILKIRKSRGKEDGLRLPERLGYTRLPRPPGRLVWLHGASVGEAQSLLILIDEIVKKDPACHVLVTTGTVTSARLLEGRLPPRAFHQFLPVDSPRAAARFLNSWQPDAVLWCESDLWPNLLRAVARRNIPAALINAHLSPRSYRQWQYAKDIVRDVLDAFTVILAQTAEDSEKLGALAGRTVPHTDTLKYAAQPLPYNPAELERLKAATHRRPVWLHASTHKGEEILAATIHQQLKQEIPGLLTIVLPRHPERAESILFEWQENFSGLNVATRAAGQAIAADTDIYLADTIGETGLFFRLSPITVMGRSLSDDGGGGHNPIEPAQLKSAVISGPNVANLQNIFDAMEQARALVIAPDETNLAARIKGFLQDADACRTQQESGFYFVQTKANVLITILNHLEPVLSARPGAGPARTGTSTRLCAWRHAPGFWFNTGAWQKTALWPLATVYSVISALHRAFSLERPAPLPVICIGNITLGGSGKTPAAIEIMRLVGQLHPQRGQGFFLTRGYGGRMKGPVRVDTGHNASDIGDEALLLARKAGTIVAADRFEGALLAKHDGADFIIMDDGWQNPGIRKDCVVAVIDAARGFGNRALFPAGPLRQELDKALPRADAFLLVGNDTHGLHDELAKHAPVFTAHKTIAAAANGTPVWAFCGIGNPDSFRASLVDAGYTLAGFTAFPDHHPFDDGELEDLKAAATAGGWGIVTTEKDFVRIPPARRGNIQPVPLTLRIDREDALCDLIAQGMDRARQ